MELSNHQTYSEKWKHESEILHKAGVYTSLASLTPEGNVLEFGCGSGWSTAALSEKHSVLSLENNELLIEEAKRYLAVKGGSANIRQSDFFSLTLEDKQAIINFSPRIIVGWLIGGSGKDQVLRVPGEPNPAELSKSYREKIEDIIVSPDVCISSVEYIQLASRGMGIAGSDDKAAFPETKANYDEFVFNQAGFEVVSVDTIPWPVDQSQFPYGHAHNPNFAGGKKVEVVPLITSILAKRITI